MAKFTERQRAELRDAFARSRIEAQEEMKRLARSYHERKEQERDALNVVALPVNPSAFEIAGQMAEMLTALEQAAADMDDNVLSSDIHAIRLRLTKVGSYLAREKRNSTGARGTTSERSAAGTRRSTS